MEGIISNFRQGRHTQRTDEMIVVVFSVTTKDAAEKMLGKEITWVSPAGKEIKGKVTKAHGNSGALKVKFEKGMPGQSVGQKVKIGA